MKVLKACCLRNGEKNNNKHIVTIAIDEDDEVHSVTEWKAFYSSIWETDVYIKSSVILVTFIDPVVEMTFAFPYRRKFCNVHSACKIS